MHAPRTLLALAILVVAAMALPLTMSAARSQTELVGTLELLHGEDFDSGAATYEYSLQTGAERVKLKFAGDAPDGFVNGARVRVKGNRDGSNLVALDGTAGAQVLASAPSWSGPRKLAVVLVNFSNNSTKPFTRTYASGIVFTNPNSVRAYYAEQSHGLVSLAGTVFDWVRIPYSNSTCAPLAWDGAARAALTARGVDLSSFTNFVFMFPQTSACAWRGMGHLPGPSSWINGMPTLRTTAHELGHNFGVHHASSLRCTSNGVRVALSSTCTRSEYGDPFTTMGGSSQRHGTNLALVQMGYIGESATRTIVANGTYTLTQASASTGVRILGIPRGDGSWIYLEYRRPYGTYFDNFSSTSAAVKGVAIRLGGTWSAMTQTKLVDTVPSTTTFDDAPLRFGQTFKDYVSGTTITVTYLGATTASVRVTLPADTKAPSAPGAFVATGISSSSVQLTWTASTDNRAVAGYRIWRGTTLVATSPPTARTLTNTRLAGGTAYTYTIRALDRAGNLSAPVTATATTRPIDTAPSAPGSLGATVTATSTRLSWTAATDNIGVTGYRVWRDGLLVGSTAALSFSVASLAPVTTYAWSVRAVDTAGQLGAIAQVTATTLFIDLTAPTAPTATIAASNSHRADLTWTASVDNVGVVGYQVYRSGELFATTTAGDRELRVPMDGSYTVRAVDGAGNLGPASNAAAL